jgi:hypothetical protein
MAATTLASGSAISDMDTVFTHGQVAPNTKANIYMINDMVTANLGTQINQNMRAVGPTTSEKASASLLGQMALCT